MLKYNFLATLILFIGSQAEGDVVAALGGVLQGEIDALHHQELARKREAYT